MLTNMTHNIDKEAVFLVRLLLERAKAPTGRRSLAPASIPPSPTEPPSTTLLSFIALWPNFMPGY